jgi:hypothetical protein
MRKTLWVVPLLILCMAIVSTPASADSLTIIETGGDVTAIDGLTILGNTYDVTFVNTITPAVTFTSQTDGETAATAIDNALNGISSFPYTILGGVNVFVPYSSTLDVGISCGSGSCTGPTWTMWTTAIYIPHNPTLGPFPYAEFTVVSTPEPGTLSLLLVGLGLCGLMMRKL